MSVFGGLTKLVLFLLWFVAVCTPPYMVWRWLRSRKPSTSAKPLIVDGANRIVPVLATFSGIRGLSWIGVSNNNLSPKLVMEPNGINFKTIRSQSRRFDEIEQVDLRIFGATVNICFFFRGRAATFEANVGNLKLARQVLDLLPAHVSLSDRARNFVNRQDIESGEYSESFISNTSTYVEPVKTRQRRFTFLPRWKEELVVTAQEGSFVLVLAMGKPTAYLPLQTEWEHDAPEWARPLWNTLRDELKEWCDDNHTPLVVGSP